MFLKATPLSNIFWVKKGNISSMQEEINKVIAIKKTCILCFFKYWVTYVKLPFCTILFFVFISNFSVG